MKRLTLRLLSMALLLLSALTAMSADYLTIHFKDGSTKRYFWPDVVQMTQSKYDMDGVLRHSYQTQVLEMPNGNTYSYPLAAIDSITFTKVDEAAAVAQADKGIGQITQIFAQSATVEDMAQHADQIKQIEGVERVEVTSSGMNVEFESGYGITYSFQKDIAPDNLEPYMAMISDSGKRMIRGADEYEKKPSLLIATQQFRDLSRDAYTNTLYPGVCDEYRRHGFEAECAKSLSMRMLTDSLYNYDLVMISTHGGYIEGIGHFIATSDELGQSTQDYSDAQAYEQMVERYPNLSPASIGVCCIKEQRNPNNESEESYWYYTGVTENFFNNVVTKSFPREKNPIVFCAACHTMEGNYDFAEAFINRGAKTYIGYDQTVTIGKFAGAFMYLSMLNGATPQAVIDQMPEELLRDRVFDEHDNFQHIAHLDYYTGREASNEILGLTYVSPKTGGLKTAADGKVQLNASYHHFGTTLKWPKKDQINRFEIHDYTNELPGVQSCGFVYGYDALLKDDVKEVECTPQKSDTYGIMTMSADVDVDKTQTLYYQAYLYDGVNYNYGNVMTSLMTTIEDIDITEGDLTLSVGDETQLHYTVKPADTYADMGWYSTNTDVAVVDQTGLVTATGPGRCLISLDLRDPVSSISDEIEVVVTEETPHDYVDLGLPSKTLWATCNIGADRPEKVGGYYAWGETQPKMNFKNNYQFADTQGNMTKYYYADQLKTLLPEDDAATQAWGKDWRMPTKEEIEELINSCTWKLGYVGGKTVYQGTYKSKTIYLPLSGVYNERGPQLIDSEVQLWSSSLDPTNATRAYFFHGYTAGFVQKATTEASEMPRYVGLNIRAVRADGGNAHYIIPEKGVYEMPSEGGTFYLKYSSDLQCQVKSDVGWITVSGTTVIVSSNESEEPRMGKIIIYNEAQNLKKSVVVLQAAHEYIPPAHYIYVTEPTMFYASEGGSAPLTYESDVECDVKVNADWMHLNGNQLSVDPNPSMRTRSGIVTITNEEFGLKDQIDITQYGIQDTDVLPTTLQPDIDKNNAILRGSHIDADVAEFIGFDLKEVGGTYDRIPGTHIGNGVFTSSVHFSFVDQYACRAVCIINGKEMLGDIVVFKIDEIAAPQDVPVHSITVTGDKKTLTVGETLQLYAEVHPAAAKVRDVDWISSNTMVAAVSTTGLVTALGAGTVLISAVAKDGSEVKGHYVVTVKARDDKRFVTTYEPHYLHVTIPGAKQRDLLSLRMNLSDELDGKMMYYGYVVSKKPIAEDLDLNSYIHGEGDTYKNGDQTIYVMLNNKRMDIDGYITYTNVYTGAAYELSSVTEKLYMQAFVWTADGELIKGNQIEYIPHSRIDAPTSGYYIDLGASVLWTSSNYGASSPTDYGSFYLHSDSKKLSFTAGARIPTGDEWDELTYKKTVRFVITNSDSSKNGILYVGGNGNSIFCPLAGVKSGSEQKFAGQYMFYINDEGSWGHHTQYDINYSRDEMPIRLVRDKVSRANAAKKQPATTESTNSVIYKVTEQNGYPLPSANRINRK